MHFSSPKDLLLHYGKIEKIGRGRISAANHAFIAERIAAGDSIGGYESTTISKPTGEKVFKNAAPVASGEKAILELMPKQREESEVQAHVFVDGKKRPVGMREVCVNCRVSFTYCPCEIPMFRVDVDDKARVYFTKRTTPFRKDW